MIRDLGYLLGRMESRVLDGVLLYDIEDTITSARTRLNDAMYLMDRLIDDSTEEDREKVMEVVHSIIQSVFNGNQDLPEAAGEFLASRKANAALFDAMMSSKGKPNGNQKV